MKTCKVCRRTFYVVPADLPLRLPTVQSVGVSTACGRTAEAHKTEPATKKKKVHKALTAAPIKVTAVTLFHLEFSPTEFDRCTVKDHCIESKSHLNCAYLKYLYLQMTPLLIVCVSTLSLLCIPLLLHITVVLYMCLMLFCPICTFPDLI